MRSCLNVTSFARRTLLLAGATALLAGCATPEPASPEDRVRVRAEARWKAFIAGDLERAYGFLSPASRAILPFDRYRANLGPGVAWKQADVASVTCESNEKCTVRLNVVYDPVMFRQRIGSIQTSIEETWVLDGNQWWLLHRI